MGTIIFMIKIIVLGKFSRGTFKILLCYVEYIKKNKQYKS